MIGRLGLHARLALVGLPGLVGLAGAGLLAVSGRGDLLDSSGFASAAVGLAVLGLVILALVAQRTAAELDRVAQDANSLLPETILEEMEGTVMPARHSRRNRYGSARHRARDRDDASDAVAAPLAQGLAAAERAAVIAAVRHGEAVRDEMGDAVLRLAQRNQVLLDRQLALLDEFEDTELDPDGLDRLFRLDHLATQMRRRNDGLMVLSGAAATDPDEQPVAVLDVLRGAVSAVEPFTRVAIQSTAVVSLPGALASDVALLLAELVDNATRASHADTRVQLMASMSATGLTVHVIDHGPGLTERELHEIEQLLARHPRDRTLASGRGTGLAVVARLAARHGLRVSYGTVSPQGTQVTIEVPGSLVGGGGPAHVANDEGAAVPIVLAQVRRHDRLTARKEGAGRGPTGPAGNGSSGEPHSPFVVWQPRAARTPVAPAVAVAMPSEPTRFTPIAHSTGEHVRTAAGRSGAPWAGGAGPPDGPHAPHAPGAPDAHAWPGRGGLPGAEDLPAVHELSGASGGTTDGNGRAGGPGLPPGAGSPGGSAGSGFARRDGAMRAGTSGHPGSGPPPAGAGTGPAHLPTGTPISGQRVTGEAPLFRLADTGAATSTSLLGSADPVVAGGLVRRVPGATLRDDTVGASGPNPAGPPIDLRGGDSRPRDPDEVRSRMAAYRRGVALGRDDGRAGQQPPTGPAATSSRAPERETRDQRPDR